MTVTARALEAPGPPREGRRATSSGLTRSRLDDTHTKCRSDQKTFVFSEGGIKAGVSLHDTEFPILLQKIDLKLQNVRGGMKTSARLEHSHSLVDSTQKKSRAAGEVSGGAVDRNSRFYPQILKSNMLKGMDVSNIFLLHSLGIQH